MLATGSAACHLSIHRELLGQPCCAACLQSVEGMKVLCFELMEASGGRASASTLADLAASANELVVELTRRVHQVGYHHKHQLQEVC